MSLYRPSSAGYEGSVFLTTMSQNKQAPKWSFAGRYGFANSRLLTPGPGTYGADSRSQRQAGYGFGSCARDQGPLSMASPGPGAYGASECYRSAAAPTELITGGLGMVVELQDGKGRVVNGDARESKIPICFSGSLDRANTSGVKVKGRSARDTAALLAGMGRCSTPGPGTYSDCGRAESTLNKKGPLSISAPRWGFGTSNRGIRANGQNPGPGQYDLRAWVAKPRGLLGRV
ncbi:unnamed protein product [Symbiodinium sp. KB8]|nr:unnamed protein product [Symbiodinium sp. KB8]